MCINGYFIAHAEMPAVTAMTYDAQAKVLRFALSGVASGNSELRIQIAPSNETNYVIAGDHVSAQGKQVVVWDVRSFLQNDAKDSSYNFLGIVCNAPVYGDDRDLDTKCGKFLAKDFQMSSSGNSSMPSTSPKAGYEDEVRVTSYHCDNSSGGFRVTIADVPIHSRALHHFAFTSHR